MSFSKVVHYHIVRIYHHLSTKYLGVFNFVLLHILLQQTPFNAYFSAVCQLFIRYKFIVIKLLGFKEF